MKPLSCWRVADEYLPEIFEFETHHANREGLDEFDRLFSILPMSEDTDVPPISEQERRLMNSEIEKLVESVRRGREDYSALKSRNEAAILASEFEWLRFVPRSLWVLAAASIMAYGRVFHRPSAFALGASIQNYSRGKYF